MMSLQKRFLSVVFSTLLLLSQLSYSQGAKFDTSYISDDSFFVMRFDIERLRSYEKMASTNLEVIGRGLKKNLGLDINTMKAITIQFGLTDDGPFDNAFSITFEHTKPIDKKLMSKTSEFKMDDFTKTELGGKTYLRHRRDGGPHLFFSNDKTVSLATAKAVESLVLADKGKGKMAGLITSSPPKSEIRAAFSANQGLNDLLESMKFLQGAMGLPDETFDSVAKAKSGIGSVNLASSTPVFVQVQFESEGAAKTMMSSLKSVRQIAKSALPLGLQELEEYLEEGKNRPASKSRDLEMDGLKLGITALKESGKLLDLLKTEVKGKQVTLKIQNMGGLKQWQRIASDSITLMFRDIERYDEPRAIDGKDEAFKERKKEDF